jgi:hypothetical protein
VILSVIRVHHRQNPLDSISVLSVPSLSPAIYFLATLISTLSLVLEITCVQLCISCELPVGTQPFIVREERKWTEFELKWGVWRLRNEKLCDLCTGDLVLILARFVKLDDFYL